MKRLQKIFNGFLQRNKQQRIVFLSYGDKIFTESRKRIAREAAKIDFFDKIIVETEKIKQDGEFLSAIRSNADFKQINSKERGGGYYLWKPYALYKNLQKLNGDDILIYCDAGSTIPCNDYTMSTLKEYCGIVNGGEKGVLLFRNPHKESRWTKGDIFKHFNCIGNEKICESRQFSDGIMQVIPKCDHSMSIYSRWWETAKKPPRLFDDSPSKPPNFANFKENIHEQSVLSIISKIHGVEEIDNWESIPIVPTKIRK